MNYIQIILSLKVIYKILGGHFDIDHKISEINELENKLNNSDIWNDVDYANEITQKLSLLKKDINQYNVLSQKVLDNLELLELYKIDNDQVIYDAVSNDLEEIKGELKEFEIKTLLNGEFDSSNCYLEIHPGAGGTEAQDWADMLLRMYLMFFDKNDYKYEIIDKQQGNEAGIKSVMVHVTSPYAYGYLKGEIGVHRLVRISPFDSNARRHTSFAAVNITPEFSEVEDIVVNDDDIRIDVFRSSGNGGQGVNTTDSAVRITHIKTGIVVSVQNERSQLKNKEIALKILKSKLYKLEIDKRNEEINSLKGNSNIDFGSQIRNYVLEPYSLVKDLRSGYESNMPLKVLDGDLMPFIDAYIRMR